MTKRRVLLVMLMVISLAIFIVVVQLRQPSQQKAEQRALDFAHAVNYEYEEPEKIYEFLHSSLKMEMSIKEFKQAFIKERSYPYLTPLYFNYRDCVMSEDLLRGTVLYSQAARLPGMTQEIDIIFEDGNYYFLHFEELSDGSYLEKFEDVPYSLDMYFDFDVTEDED